MKDFQQQAMAGMLTMLLSQKETLIAGIPNFEPTIAKKLNEMEDSFLKDKKKGSKMALHFATEGEKINIMVVIVGNKNEMLECIEKFSLTEFVNFLFSLAENKEAIKETIQTIEPDNKS